MCSGYQSACYQMIQDQAGRTANRLTIKDMCTICCVSRSGYYNWINNKEKRKLREQKDLRDFLLIMEAYRYRGYKKGCRSIHMRLLHVGIRMNVKKIRRLMKKYHLSCPIRKVNPYRRLMREMRTNMVADNRLNREFRKHGPRSVLLTDITYLPLNRGFVYLSVIKDAYTEQILSYVISESLKVDFVLETVKNLIRDHGISLSENVMIHSDQGCHYTSVDFRRLLDDHGLRQSMSRRGNCWDNAPQESFFGHMKDELQDYAKQWKTIGDVRRDISDWIDYYNKDRGQWHLNKLSPNEFYGYSMTGIDPLSTV